MLIFVSLVVVLGVLAFSVWFLHKIYQVSRICWYYYKAHRAKYRAMLEAAEHPQHPSHQSAPRLTSLDPAPVDDDTEEDSF